MKMFAVLPMFIVAFCATECFGESAHCPSGWTQFGAYCYLVSSEIMTQPEAKTRCQGLEGDLVKINSDEENEFVLQAVRKKAPSLKQVWIGLEKRGRCFYWSDLSVPIFTKWAPGEPNNKGGNEHCGHMYVGGHSDRLPDKASGYWNDMTCQGDSKFPNGFVCKCLGYY